MGGFGVAGGGFGVAGITYVAVQDPINLFSTEYSSIYYSYRFILIS